MREFEGGVFSDALPGGRAGAQLCVREDGVHAVTADGTSFAIPLTECQIEIGGASGRMWFCRNRTRDLTLFSEAVGFAQALSERRELAGAVGAIVEAKRAQRKRSSAIAAGLLLALALVVWGGFLALRQAGRASVTLLPRSVDEQLGELAIENMDLGGRVLEDATLSAGVKEIVDRLARHAKPGFTFRVRVVDSATVNAFALPGGFVVVYTGLIRAAKEPAQLAGVLAHELAHVTERHGMQRIAQSLGLVTAVQLLFGDVSGLAAIAVQVLREGAINSYSREQEREADREGVRTLRAAQVDPSALADFFALLAQRQGSLPRAVAWLGTHPDLEERIATVRREAQSQPTHTAPFALRWDELQRRAAGAGEP
jgi:predicted Zn-dependent protease